MEENLEIESKKIMYYGNLTEELFGNEEKFAYLCSKYEE